MNPKETPETDGRQFDLTGVMAMLRRRAGLIILCVVIATVGAVGLSLLQEKQYSATASLLFRSPGSAENLFGEGVTSSVQPDPVRELATNEQLVGLNVIAARTAKRLGGLTREEVSGMVSVAASGEAEIVTVSATSSRPTQAKVVANTFANQFIAFRAEAESSKLLEAKQLAEEEFSRLSPEQQAGPRGVALSGGAEKLGILSSLQTGNAELVQPAEEPSVPSSPRPLRNGIVAAIVGLLLGIGLALLFERSDRRLRDAEDASEAYGLPILATIPESKAITVSNRRNAAAELPFTENESFRMLRAQLRYFNVDRDVRTVVVTSHAAGSGKSTVAWNLARIAATSSKAIVVETDLREPTLAGQHGLLPGPGLAQLLTGQAPLDSAIQSKPLMGGPGGASRGERHVDVIVAGSRPPNPAELIESEAMSQILARLSERYELIVVDTAPIGVVSDAFPLMRTADGVIVVARIGQTTRDTAHEMREQLDRLDVPVLGIVANGIKLRHGGRYGYGPYGRGPDMEPAPRSNEPQPQPAEQAGPVEPFETAAAAHGASSPPPSRPPGPGEERR